MVTASITFSLIPPGSDLVWFGLTLTDSPKVCLEAAHSFAHWVLLVNQGNQGNLLVNQGNPVNIVNWDIFKQKQRKSNKTDSHCFLCSCTLGSLFTFYEYSKDDIFAGFRPTIKHIEPQYFNDFFP